MSGPDLKINDIERILSGRQPGVIGNYSCYSVLVPLVNKDGKLNLLFEMRSPGLLRQPGEVCFPGGKMEDGETAEECAVRETAEELGISAGSVRVISELDALHTYSNSTLYSVLGEIGIESMRTARVNREEVESVFYVPLSEFLENEPFIYRMEVLPVVREDFPYEMINFSEGYSWGRGSSEVPIYRFGETIIWGLTARIIHNLVRVLTTRV